MHRQPTAKDFQRLTSMEMLLHTVKLQRIMNISPKTPNIILSLWLLSLLHTSWCQVLNVVKSANISLDVDFVDNILGGEGGLILNNSSSHILGSSGIVSEVSSLSANDKYELLSPPEKPSSSSSSAVKSVYGQQSHRIPLHIGVLPPLPPPPRPPILAPVSPPLLPYPAGSVKYPAYVNTVYTRVKLGYGTFYYDGRNAELRCRFPYNLQVLSNVVWNKVSDNLYHYLDAYRVFEHSHGHTTTLYIRDVQAKDFGIYACVVSGSFHGAQAVTFYQEVNFFPPPPSGPVHGASVPVPVVIGK